MVALLLLFLLVRDTAAQPVVAPVEPASSASSRWPLGVGATADLRDAIARVHRPAFEDAIERGGDWRGAGLPDDAVLSMAAAFDARRAVSTLLARGLTPDAFDLNGETALVAAAFAGAARSTTVLLESGADPNLVVRSRRAHGWTPLFAATVAGRLEVIRLLLAAGAEVDVADDHGRTPLLYAALHGQSAAALLLVRGGADPRRADEVGRTPLSVATSLGHRLVLASFQAAAAGKSR